jgi:hypothetical protein
MRVEFIKVHRDGPIEFMYDDGDLFWGHQLVAIGTLAGGVTSAEIQL